MRAESFGDFCKRRREKLGVSLRAFCLENEIDPSNWSKIERGRLPPPRGEYLERYAKALGIGVGSSEWHEFADLADVAAGRLPADLQEGEVAAKLPVFFRTLRESAKNGGRDSDELIEELKRTIRES